MLRFRFRKVCHQTQRNSRCVTPSRMINLVRFSYDSLERGASFRRDPATGAVAGCKPAYTKARFRRTKISRSTVPQPFPPINKRRDGLEISRACWAVVRPECGNPSDLWLIEPARVRDRLTRAAGYERRVRRETGRHTRGRFPPAVANAVFSKPAPNNRSCKSSTGET